MRPDIVFYKNKIKDLENLIAVTSKKDNRISLIRLFLFIVFAVFMILAAVTSYKVIMLIAGAAFFIAFCVFVSLHGKIKDELAHYITLKEVTELYIARFEGDFSKLTDSGEEFEDPKDDYSLDLDLFGARSLFSLFNISDTDDGRRAFAKDLACASSVTDTVARQKAIAELLTKKDFLLSYQAVSREGNLRKPVNALKAISSDKGEFSSSLKTFSYILPCMWIIPLILYLTGFQFYMMAVLAIVVINITVFMFLSSRYKLYFKAVDGIHKQTAAISALYDLCEKEDFSDPMIKDLVKGGAADGHKASEGLAALSSTCNFCKFRSQPFFALLLNIAVPFDLYCAEKLIKWVRTYGSELRTSLACLARLESLMCCACVGLVSRESSFPEFTDKAYFKGEEICHPLLDPHTAVSNSITIDSKRVLITGSNMSGKTTLIRTVGVVCVLGYLGAPVPAKSAGMGRMRIMSSMRIVDSLEENMSTFKAELVRIARIVKAAENNEAILFLIDEIFRGTNSADRTDGALAVLQKLDRPNIIGLMTTHDYALCDKVRDIINIAFYHFSESYDDEGISFDYKLHDGICTNSNAKYLMKLVGIV